MASGSIAIGLLQGLVAIQFQIAVEVGGAQAKALGDDLHFIGMGDEISHSVLSSLAIRPVALAPLALSTPWFPAAKSEQLKSEAAIYCCSFFFSPSISSSIFAGVRFS